MERKGLHVTKAESMTARTKLSKVAIVDEADLCVESQLFLIG